MVFGQAFVLLYVGLLFGLAWWGDRRQRQLVGARSAWLYPLTLAIFCTSWTFYGSVGLASRSGFAFLPVYLGPLLAVTLLLPLLRRIVMVAKAQNVTSIADLIAARFGKDQSLAAFVTVIAVVGIIPYIALQLKAVAVSWATLAGNPGQTADISWMVALVMAVFAIVFGTRHIDSTEHHHGLMLAIAFESLVKLFAFLIIGGFVVWGLFDGFADLLSDQRVLQAYQSSFVETLDGFSLMTGTFLAFLAFLCLPRQFHVAVVEQAQERDFDTARWGFSSYLIAINLFVVPVALAGMVLLPGSDPDFFMISLPLMAERGDLALIAFLGGFSAATSMIIVESVALATMICNEIVVPASLKLRAGYLQHLENPARFLLRVRRIAICAILLLAYGFERGLGEKLPLAQMGLLSFVALSQVAPALIGGLTFRSISKVGVLSGLTIGIITWFWCLVVPALASANLAPADWLHHGPLGLTFLRPQQLFGLSGLDPISHALIWSLLLNGIGLLLGSFVSPPKGLELAQAQSMAFDGQLVSRSLLPAKTEAKLSNQMLSNLVGRFVGFQQARQELQNLARDRGQYFDPDQPADLIAIECAERMLAGVLGSASAKLVMASIQSGQAIDVASARYLAEQASQAMRSNRSLLEAAFENIDQGIAVFNYDRQLVAWNQHLVQLFELPDRLLRAGTSLTDILRWNAQRGEYGDGPITELVHQQLSHFEGNLRRHYERHRPDGRSLDIRINPMPDGGIVATYTDITLRVRQENALREAKETLDQRVEERTRDLFELNQKYDIARREAENANHSKTRFLAAISHDLLQPLNAARLFVAALERRESLEDGDLALVAKTDAALRGIEDLLSALLDISKLDAGAWDAEPRDFNLAELFEALAADFDVLAQQRGLDFRTVISKCWVRSDPRLLRRVLQNLLSNALRYTRKGRVLLGVRRLGDQLRIEVWDTGPGIAAHQQQEIFLEFRRLQREDNASEKGVGLGLSIVQRLAQLLDHKISLRSTPGKGSCFAVTVPRANPQPIPDRKATSGHSIQNPFNARKILVIDNEVAILEGMVVLLQGWGAEVKTARDQTEAFQILENFVPELVFVDYHLDEGANGLDLVAALRHQRQISAAFVLITADRQPSVVDLANQMNVQVLHKPVRPAALRALASKLLG